MFVHFESLRLTFMFVYCCYSNVKKIKHYVLWEHNDPKSFWLTSSVPIPSVNRSVTLTAHLSTQSYYCGKNWFNLSSQKEMYQFMTTTHR